VPTFNFQFLFQPTIAWGFALSGIVVAGLGFLEFKRVKTTVNPTKPGSSSILVTRGVYQHTRNPMYLGFLSILFGWAIGSGSLLAFLFLPAFVLYMNEFQIKPEERALAAIFGEEFQKYRSRVRRWI
jgi:protein-S-isoprenylcysteine O-methyltransferase Ste14